MATPMQIKQPVLVTGALGFIGRKLVARLLAQGCSVIAFDLPGLTLPIDWQGKVEYVAGDISSAASVNQAVEKAGSIIHLAAMVGDWGGEELHKKVTVDGTENIFKAALKSQCKMVLASSIVVYGDKIDQGICSEEMDFGKIFGPYSRSKQAQEKIAQNYIQKGLDVTIVRPSNVYGAGSKPWVDDLVCELKAGRPALISGGTFNAGLVHVDNVVEIFYQALSNPKAKGQIYNACDEDPITWQQYMNDLAELSGSPKPGSIPKPLAKIGASLLEFIWRLAKQKKRPPLTHEALNLIASKHKISITKAKVELGYQPLTQYQDGLKEIASYLNK